MLGAQLPTPLPFRIFISGSAPLPMQTLREFEEKFKVPLIEGYGLSEASPVVSKNPLRGVRKAGSIGIPIANVEMSVQDESENFSTRTRRGRNLCSRRQCDARLLEPARRNQKSFPRRLAVDRRRRPSRRRRLLLTSPTARRTCCSSTASTSIRARSKK